ncbi:MAG: hypothetical protein G01um10143_558 [Parcubacteria group bacterium Gr01-1014_3]|nr:MAG: hypothetical protein G01um10143_558 [Parcubacteria group bacterium Gr01-1014_3]
MRNVAPLLLVCSIALLSCEGKSTPITNEQSSAPTSAKDNTTALTSVKGNGSLKVKFTYLGKVPKKKISDPYCGDDIIADNLLVGENKELKDVVMYLDIDTEKKFENQPELTIDQKGCLFIPKVLLAKPGDKIKIKNSDDTLHNVHILADLNTGINSGLPRQGSEITYEPTTAEFIKIMCDVHPWMGGWIVVRKHPYYALSGSDGVAELKDIPAGKYKLHLRHFSLGHMEQEVEIKDGETTDLAVEFVKEKK